MKIEDRTFHISVSIVRIYKCDRDGDMRSSNLDFRGNTPGNTPATKITNPVQRYRRRLLFYNSSDRWR